MMALASLTAEGERAAQLVSSGAVCSKSGCEAAATDFWRVRGEMQVRCDDHGPCLACFHLEDCDCMEG